MEDVKFRSGLSSSSRTYRTTQKSPSYLGIDFDEIEGYEDIIGDYPCPYCTEEFDLVELICHIDDEHPLEAKSGVCPVCGTRLRVDMVGHIILQHGNILQKLKLLKRDSFVKEELDDEYYHSPSPGSTSAVSSTMAPDPLLTFLNLSIAGDKVDHLQQSHLTETIVEEKNSNESLLERNVQQPPLSDQEHMEMKKKSEFVQGLLFSTIFEDDGL